MSNSETQPQNKKPSFIAYIVEEGKNDENYWTKVGVAFEHADGKGFNLNLSAIPVNGKITLRKQKDQ